MVNRLMINNHGIMIAGNIDIHVNFVPRDAASFWLRGTESQIPWDAAFVPRHGVSHK